MSFAASLLNDLVEEEAQEKVLAMVRALDSVWKPQQCFPSLLALEMRQQVSWIAPEVQITQAELALIKLEWQRILHETEQRAEHAHKWHPEGPTRQSVPLRISLQLSSGIEWHIVPTHPFVQQSFLGSAYIGWDLGSTHKDPFRPFGLSQSLLRPYTSSRTLS